MFSANLGLRGCYSIWVCCTIFLLNPDYYRLQIGVVKLKLSKVFGCIPHQLNFLVLIHRDLVKILSQQKIGCGGHFVFLQKLLKINTSLTYATLYPHTKFGDDIFITFPLIDRTSSAENWLWRPSCCSEIVENQYQPSIYHLIAI